MTRNINLKVESPEMRVIENEDEYRVLAQEFVIRYIEKTAALLNGQDFVPFEISNLNQESREFLYNLCFLGIAAFEEKSGFRFGDEVFTPRPTFELQNDLDSKTVLVGQQFLHELVDESIDIAVHRTKNG